MVIKLGHKNRTEASKMIVDWLEEALDDLEALRQYIAEENVTAANRIAKRIISAVDLLSEQPNIGRHGRVSGTRELVISETPFIIPYCVEKKTVQILRVFHSAMLLPEV